MKKLSAAPIASKVSRVATLVHTAIAKAEYLGKRLLLLGLDVMALLKALQLTNAQTILMPPLREGTTKQSILTYRRLLRTSQ